LILLFVGVAVASGIGHPSVPSGSVAVVTDMPGGEVEITTEQFDRAKQQMAVQAQLDEVPPEDDPKYKEVAGAALNDLLDVAWITGAAAEGDINVTQRQIDEQLKQVAQQNFNCKKDEDPFKCKELKDFLKQSKYTQDDVVERIKVGLLSNELQQSLTEDAPKPTQSQLRAYYDAFSSQFQLPASSDLRVIQTEKKGQAEKAKAELEKDNSVKSWEKVAKKYSNDAISKDNGGLRESISAGMFEEKVQNEMDKAEIGQLVGPVKGETGYYVFQVEKRNPERLQDFDEVREQIEQQVSQQLASAAQTNFINNYRNVWTSRTFCAEQVLTDRCANAGGENVFLTAEQLKQQRQATKDQAPALKGRMAWPKPPNTLAFPIDPVSPSGTQIVCYLEEGPEGSNFPLTGIAPPQRPHPAGPDEAINAPPEGQEEGQETPPTCGATNPTAFGGGMPLG
jgi:parvulin-like peptidyl-prolyl isomerase